MLFLSLGLELRSKNGGMNCSPEQEIFFHFISPCVLYHHIASEAFVIRNLKLNVCEKLAKTC